MMGQTQTPFVTDALQPKTQLFISGLCNGTATDQTETKQIIEIKITFSPRLKYSQIIIAEPELKLITVVSTITEHNKQTVGFIFAIFFSLNLIFISKNTNYCYLLAFI